MSSGILSDYVDYCKIRNSARENNVIDLSECSFFHPTCLLPLLKFMNNNSDMKCIDPPQNVRYYMSLIASKHIYEGSSYIPYLELPHDHSKVSATIDVLCEHHNNGIDYGGKVAFNYMIAELIDNIYQHSQFDSASVMAQRYPNKGFVDVTICDDGISIPHCFEINDLFSEDFDSDCDAISAAIKGTSTKNDGRGYGLSTTINLYVNGCDASFLLVSRNGAFYKTKKEATFYNTEGLYSYDGTLVSLRIPYPINKVNIYDYIA